MIEFYLSQIESLEFKPITFSIWETIQFEGLDEEFESNERKHWDYSNLKIKDEHVSGLKNFNPDTVNFFNKFDIQLKENYNNLIDFIDYDKGTVKIIKCLNKK